MMIEKAKECSHRFQDGYSIGAFNKEFRTLRLYLPRQSGLTTSTLKAVSKYFNRPLYINDSKKMISLLKNNKEYKNIVFFTPTQLIKNRDRFIVGCSFDCVIVDNVSCFDEKYIKSITENEDLTLILKSADFFLFILIG